MYTRSPSASVASSYSDLRPPPSFNRSRNNSTQNSPRHELPGFNLPIQSRPTIGSRSATGTFEGGASYQNSRDVSPAPGATRLSRVPTDNSVSGAYSRSQLRPTKRTDNQQADVFGDPELDDGMDERSISPAGSYASGAGAYSRSASFGAKAGYNGSGAYGDEGRKKAPPPPPPNRAKKPPPPPPMKRSALSTSDVPRMYD